MKKDIFDYENKKIGVLELPDDTPIDIWEKKLSAYKVSPVIPPVFLDVTPRQIRQALILSGFKLEDITAFINSQPEPTKSMALVEWEYSISFKRNNNFVNTLGLMLGFDKEKLDNLWIMASKL